MRRSLFLFATALVVLAGLPSVAAAHSSFLGASPAPGVRLSQAPGRVQLRFTEPLNDRLSKVRLVSVDTRRQIGVGSAVKGKRLTLIVPAGLVRGAYRVQWHSVSVDDGHALDGTFSFGVRAAAAGGQQSVQQSPFARLGWLRVASHIFLYAALLLFCGAVLLEAFLRRPELRSWLIPQELLDAGTDLDVAAVANRHRRVILDAGFAAIMAAALAATADAADAADGFSPTGLSDFLLHAGAGRTRLYVVGLLIAALAAVAVRLRAAAVPALGALLALAFSGHANASSPRGLAIFNDWLHLASTSLWVGGIALLVLAWGPTVRAAARPQRLQVARHVLPAFGQVALPAFAVVAVTGVGSAIIELGSFAAIWQTGYGRVLILKTDLVLFIAAASFQHARRLRPRLLDQRRSTPDRLERRLWRLLGVEPLLAIGVVAAVAVLVGFPLPPRQLDSAEEARAAAGPTCAPCPLPAPKPGELAVAEQAGSNVVAAWMRRDGSALIGTVRVYDLRKAPRRGPFAVLGATSTACGDGCRRFRLMRPGATVDVAVPDRGRTYVAHLAAVWREGGGAEARRVLLQAQGAMRALRSVRELEQVSSVPGLQATTQYVLAAPNRMTFRTDLGVQSVVVGAVQWLRAPGLGYRRMQFGGGLPFRTRTWFTWSTYALNTYLLRREREGGHDVDVIALMDPGTPAWWQLHIDRHTHRVLHDRLVTYAHFSAQEFTDFNAPVHIKPPVLEP